MISGISPYDLISCGFIYLKTFSSFSLITFSFAGLNPIDWRFNLVLIIFSIPSKAPPAIKRILDVSISINFWSGCFLPPLGGTFTIVPSSNLSKACWTPSPETSLVIEGLSLFLAILSISSINTIPFWVLSTSKSAAWSSLLKILSTSSPT